MAVDRGGLQYAIVVDDRFSAVTEKFRTELGASEQAWKAFASAGTNAALQNARMTEALEKLDGTLRKMEESKARTTKAAKDSAEAVDTETKAQKKLEAIMERRQVLERAHQIATAQDIDITRKITQEKFLEAAAQEKVNQSKLRAAIAARAEQLADEQGVVLGRRKIGAFDLEAAAREKLDRVRQRGLVQARFEQLAAEAGLRVKKEEAKAFDAVAEAARRAGRAKQEAQVRDVLSAQGLDAQGRPLAAPKETVPAAAGRVKDIKDAVEATNSLDHAANRVAFTFRRLFGIFAAFQAVRLVFGEIRQAISDSVAFNAQLETSALGIASIVAAAGEVRNALGETVPPVERLRLATAEARRQMTLLREEGRQTSATMEELVNAFQVSIAPGLRAGLNLDQIRAFTVKISQAAGSIGLPQNQLPEEIRSLLQGTIQSRTTRIATALGITNEDIRNAKEAGTLFELLERRFQSFAIAGKDALGTFSVMMANMKKSVQEILGEGGKEFFEALKEFGRFANEGLKDGIVVNPTAVEAIRLMGEGLRDGVREAQRLMSAIGDDRALAVAGAIGDVLQGIVAVVGRIAEGMARGFATLSFILKPVAALLSGLSAIAGGPLGTIVRLAVEFLTIAGAVKIALAAWNALLAFAAKQAGVVVAEVTRAQFAGALLVRTLSAILSPVGIAISAAMILSSVFQSGADSADEMKENITGAGKEATNLKQLLESIPNIVRPGTRSAEDDSKLMDRLREDAEAASVALATAVASAGVRGAAAKQIKDTIEGEAKARKQSLDLQKQEERLSRELADVRKSLAEAQERYAKQSDFMRGRIDDEVARTREVFDLRSKIAELEERAADRAGTSEQIRAAQELSEARSRLDFLENSRFNQVYGPEVTGIIRDRVTLTGQEAALVAEVVAAVRARQEAENAALASVNLRLRAEAQADIIESRTRTALADAALRTEITKLDVLRQQALEGRRLSDFVGQISDAEAQEREGAVRLAAARQANEAEEAALRTVLARKRAEEDSLRTQANAADTDARRALLSDQLAGAQSAVAAVEEQLRATRDRNRADLSLEEEKLRNIVDLVLLRARIEAQDTTRGLRERNALAGAELAADRERLSIAEEQERAGFVLGDTFRRIVAAEASLGPLRERLRIYRETQAIKLAELRSSEAAARDRGDVGLADAFSAQRLELERATGLEVERMAREIVNYSGEALRAARERAALETRTLGRAAGGQQADLDRERAKLALLREEEGSRFRMTELERTIALLRYDSQAARARIDAMRQEQEMAERGLEAAIAATKDADTRAALQAQLNALRAQGIRLLETETLKAQALSAEMEAGIRRDSTRAARGIEEQGLPQAQAGLSAERLKNDAFRTRGARSEVLSGRADLELANAQLRVQRRAAEEQEAAITAQIARLRREGAAVETVEAKERELLAIRELNGVELEKQGEIIEGIRLRLDEVTSATAASMEVLATTIEGIFTGMSQTIAQLLADALDPTKKVDAKEAFRAFFSQMFVQIAAFLLQVALLVIALNAIPGFAAVMTALGGIQSFGAAGKAAGSMTGLGGAAAEGKAEGGRVQGFGSPSLAHRAARGFVLGGRPSGLDPRDTVPIWASRDEWVIRGASVRQYGDHVMAAINEGLLDPVALRDLAGASRVSRAVPTRPSDGFASGGQVARAAGGARRGGRASPAPMTIDEKFADLVLGQGGAFDRALQRRKSAVRAMVGR